MKIFTISTLAAGLFLTSCIAGPGFPQGHGRTYLEKRGYSEDLIVRLIYRKKLQPSEVSDLQSSKSTDVRFLVARNPSLTKEQIDRSMADSNDFVRSGAAHNTSLSSGQIERLMDDESHTVYSSLAGNTTLTDKELLRLRDKRGAKGLFFATNPNCPESIRRSIIASDDSLAKKILKRNNEWKRNGYYKKNAKGRWFQSRDLP